MSELQSKETDGAVKNKNISPIKANKIGSDELQKHRELKSQNADVKSGDINSLTTTDNASNVRAADLLDILKVATNIEVKEKIEIARLQLESERLEVERVKSSTDQRFWVRNFGASITAIISLAAVLVSLSQVWVASIQKDKELAIAQTQKDQELAAAIVQQERAWKLQMAKFVLDHGDKLLGKDKAQRELMTRAMLTTFPPEFSSEIIDRLDAVADSQEVKQELQNIRKTILPKIKEKRDSEQARAIENALPGSGGSFPWWSLVGTIRQEGLLGLRGTRREYQYRYPSEPIPSPSISPTPTPHDSCRCPPPLEGGIDCWGWDDAAICRVIDGKCVARCVTARSSS